MPFPPPLRRSVLSITPNATSAAPDAGEREQARETARRVIADYMGVPADDVHIICSGVVGVGAE